MFDIATRFKNSYGSGPLHLLAMVSGFALLGYIVATARPSALWNQATWWQSIAVWFVAAVVAHDLLLYPLYALADRILARLVGRRDVSAPRRRPELPVRNYIRIPALAAGLTLLVSCPASSDRVRRHTWMRPDRRRNHFWAGGCCSPRSRSGSARPLTPFGWWWRT